MHLAPRGLISHSVHSRGASVEGPHQSKACPPGSSGALVCLSGLWNGGRRCVS